MSPSFLYISSPVSILYVRFYCMSILLLIFPLVLHVCNNPFRTKYLAYIAIVRICPLADLRGHLTM